jgi:DNA-binding transcriptional regulator/RsmH inhibitor MraZ
MAPIRPRIFERDLDQEGRLRLPIYLMDEYARVVIGLGHGYHLNMYNHQVWVEMDEALQGKWKAPHDIPVVLDQELADLNDRLRSGRIELKLDTTGRIKIPLPLLELVGIKPGGQIIGHAHGLRPAAVDDTALYYRIYDKDEWLKLNPGNDGLLQYYKKSKHQE